LSKISYHDIKVTTKHIILIMAESGTNVINDDIMLENMTMIQLKDELKKQEFETIIEV